MSSTMRKRISGLPAGGRAVAGLAGSKSGGTSAPTVQLPGGRRSSCSVVKVRFSTAPGPASLTRVSFMPGGATMRVRSGPVAGWASSGTARKVMPLAPAGTGMVPRRAWGSLARVTSYAMASCVSFSAVPLGPPENTRPAALEMSRQAFMRMMVGPLAAAHALCTCTG
jgi:hypothetical protein